MAEQLFANKMFTVTVTVQKYAKGKDVTVADFVCKFLPFMFAK